MKLSFSLALSLLLGTTLGAAISARQGGLCCFNLQDTSSGRNVQQDGRTHELFLYDPNLGDGWYCITPNSVLYDRGNNACILTSPRNSFECLDGTPGGDTWQLAGGNLLQDYGSVDFNVCNVNGRQQIFGASPPGGYSCRKTQLRTVNRTSQCQ